MIKSITLKNFQKHTNKTIDFSPYVNMIVGSTDAGKSSIIRALKWVSFNKPSGNNYITHGKKQTEVTINTDDYEIQKIKSKTKNQYNINGKELKAIGQSVPSEVSDILNLSEINFQGQHDSSYLISETSGEVGRQLNKLVDLSLIDSLLASLNKDLKEHNREIKYTDEQVKEYQAELNKYSELDDINNLLNIAKEMDNKCQEIESEYKFLCKYQEQMVELEKKRFDFSAIDKAEKEVDALLSERDKLIEELENLQDIKGKFDKLNDVLLRTGIDYKKIEIAIKQVSVLYDKYLQDNSALNELENQIKKLKMLKKQVSDWYIKDKEVEKELKIFKVCPLCKGKLNVK